MKRKDLGFFQLHVEKIVIGVAVALVAAIALFYVIGDPYAVDLSGRPVPPEQVEQVLADRAAQLDQKLRSDEPVVEDREIASYAQDFLEKVQRPVAELAQLPVPLEEPGLGENASVRALERPRLALPRPPMPQGVTARAGYGVLGEFQDREDLRAVIELVGSQVPRDFRYVSVGATFDLDEWTRRLRADTSSRRIPQNWWQNRVAVASVDLQRQRLDPATGQWVETTIVEPMPTAPGYSIAQDREFTRQEGVQALQTIQQAQPQIARAPFVPLAPGSFWVSPLDEAGTLTPEQHRDLQRLREQIDRLERQRENLLQQLNNLQERQSRTGARERPRPTRRAAPPASPYGGGGGSPYGEGGGFGGTQGPSRETTRRATPTDPVERVQQQLQELDQRLAQAVTERNELRGLPTDLGRDGRAGASPYGGEIGGGSPYSQSPYGPGGGFGESPYGPGGGFNESPYGPGGVVGGRSERRDEQQADTGEIEVWAHDLTAKPGETYRYRVIVSVLNPLFQQSRLNAEQREENMNRLALPPDPETISQSPWSEPVTLDPDYYFFLVGGSAQNQVARIEVWRLYDGVWRTDEFTNRPGDPIGGRTEVQTPGGTIPLTLQPGPLVLDLMPAQGGGGGLVGSAEGTLLYHLDPDTGRIASRDMTQDTSDPIRIRLENEAAIARDLMARLP